MGAFKTCPRKYYFSIVLGWATRKESVHLTFGRLYHAALERYDHEKFAGADHDQALDISLDWLLKATWNVELRRPWLSDDQYKNRFTLVRTVVWYLDQFRDDPLGTIKLANGKPAVELSFRFDTGFRAYTGEPFLLCGHMDRLVKFNEQIYVLDRKTTKATLTGDFFAKFTPDNQFSTYTCAGKIVYNMPTAGLIVDGAQVAVTFSRFGREFVPRSEDFLEEWLSEWGNYWVKLLEGCAKSNVWPANDKSCGNYGGCEFQGVCSKGPSMRNAWLAGQYVKRVWDPLQTRGDI